MDHLEFKEARTELGLTQNQLGQMLDTDGGTIRRIEMSPDKNTARTPAPRMIRLLKAYLTGYRPDDWPEKGN